MPRFSRSALLLDPAYDGRTSRPSSSKTSSSCEYFDADGVGRAAANAAVWFVFQAASFCVVDADAALSDEMLGADADGVTDGTDSAGDADRICGGG